MRLSLSCHNLSSSAGEAARAVLILPIIFVVDPLLPLLTFFFFSSAASAILVMNTRVENPPDFAELE